MHLDHPPVDPIVTGLRAGLQALSAALLAFPVVLSLLTPTATTPAVVVVAAVMAATAAAAFVRHMVGGPRRPALRLWWVLALTLEWALLVWLTPFAAYLVFPLFFLYLDVLPDPWGPIAVAASTIAALAALAAHGGWSIGGVLGPIVGAGVALLLGRAYRALRERDDERERLYAELLATQGRLAASERAAGVMAERERLARDIHDTVAQGLSSIALLMSAVERADPDAPTAGQVRLARETATASLAETRSLIRDLTPPPLDAQSLSGALRRLAAGAWARPGLEIVVRAADALELPMPTQTALLRIAQGAMANVLAHAHAQHVDIELVRHADAVTLRIRDDGVGFDAASLDPVALAPTGGASGASGAEPERTADSFGLRAARDRVGLLGGTFTVDSAPGAGTVVSVDLPVATS